MTRNEEKIKELCSSASADINLCRVAYTVIDNAPEEEKATLLEAFIIGYRNTPTNHSLDLPCFMDDKKKDLMLKKYGRQVDKRMMALQNMELPEKDFYDKLSENLPRHDCALQAIQEPWRGRYVLRHRHPRSHRGKRPV